MDVSRFVDVISLGMLPGEVDAMTAHNPLGTKPFWVNVYPDTNVSEATGFYDKKPSDEWADEGRLYRLKITPWIPHDGGPCPVGPDVMVRVKTRDGWAGIDAIRAAFWMRDPEDEKGDFSCDLWRHESDPENDIVAYQIVE